MAGPRLDHWCGNCGKAINLFSTVSQNSPCIQYSPSNLYPSLPPQAIPGPRIDIGSGGRSPVYASSGFLPSAPTPAYHHQQTSDVLCPPHQPHPIPQSTLSTQHATSYAQRVPAWTATLDNNQTQAVTSMMPQRWRGLAPVADAQSAGTSDKRVFCNGDCGIPNCSTGFSRNSSLKKHVKARQGNSDGVLLLTCVMCGWHYMLQEQLSSHQCSKFYNYFD